MWGYCHLGLINTPTIIDKINKRFIDVVVSGSNGYSRTEDGELWVWGPNHCGELGVGDLEERLKPFPVILLEEKYISRVFVGEGKALCLTEERVNSHHHQTFKR